MTDLTRRDFMILSGCAAIAVALPAAAASNLVVSYRFEHPDDPTGNWTAGTGRLSTFKLMQRHHVGYNLIYLRRRS